LYKASRGREGERLAGKRLERLGYRILETNYRTTGGEIDIVAMEGEAVVFVEVKTRSRGGLTEAVESVDSRKIERISTAALKYITDKGLHQMTVRFDVVAVDMSRFRPKITLIKNAFESAI
jgi:putative endonuclease